MTSKNLDSRLINELLGDGRESLRSLEKELDVSVTTVSNHLQDLETEGIITGYTPIVDYSEVGYDVTTVINLKVEGSALPDLTKRLRDEKRIISVYETTGDYDIIAIGKFKETEDMNEQIKTLLSNVDIRESNTSIVLNTIKEHEQFELNTDEE